MLQRLEDGIEVVVRVGGCCSEQVWPEVNVFLETHLHDPPDWCCVICHRLER